MTVPTPHYYLVKHPPGHFVTITVNDIPFYRRWSELHDTPSGPFNHWMLEGENTVSVVMNEPEPIPQRSFKFSMEILRHADDAPLFELVYPAFLDEHPKEERALPILHETTFRFDEPSPRPVWLDAPKTDFPIEGTPEQHAAVAELHDAKRRGDIDDFLRAGEVRTAELVKFYGPQPHLELAAARAQWGPILAEPWDLAPLELGEMTFERRGGGRTAYVSRKDGRSALYAQHKTDPDRTWEPNIHLTLVGGRWRIFALNL